MPEPFGKALCGLKTPFVDIHAVGSAGRALRKWAVKSHAIERFRRHDRVTPPHSKR